MGKTLIIAEAGVNHNGDIDLAKQLIDVAADAGVDYVKFQTFKAEKLVTTTAKKATYQYENIGETDNSQFEMLKKLELDVDTHKVLIEYCREKSIQFLSTAFDMDSIDLLEELNIDFYKIPSGEITNLPYLRKIALIGKPVIISTGMSTMQEVRNAVSVFVDNGLSLNDITVLHCNTEYPTPMVDVNLRAMALMGEDLKVNYGYSDHTLGIEVPIAAVALGGTVIEKHFTLDRNMKGPDHRASLEPLELKQMVQGIRNIEIALGSNEKKPSVSELKNINLARKSIVAKKLIQKGEILTDENISVKRPGTGISPMLWDKVIGTQSIRDFKVDEEIIIDI